MSCWAKPVLGVFCAALVLTNAACGRISIAPTCPSELQIGESGAVRANATNPGAIPTYQWEVIPSSAGTLAEPTAADTTFVATEVGDVTLRLTAADGLFQMIDECEVVVLDTISFTIALSASPTAPSVGQSVTLTCVSTGNAVATSFVLEQITGVEVALTDVDGGVARFTSDTAGTLGFRCTGSTGDGRRTTDAEVSLTVADSGVDDRPSRPDR